MSVARVVWKYVFEQIGTRQTWQIPAGSPVIHVGLDPASDRVAVWVLVTSGYQVTEERHFIVRGTGTNFTANDEYRGSVHDGGFMWHVFEERAK